MAVENEKLGFPEIVAMGVGGMVGGGIFSVLGLAISEAGHAAPLAFAVGGVIAMLTGFAYAKLGMAFHSDGGSFTYLEHAFRQHNIAGLGGWLLLVGYIGTLSLYAYTFGVYGAAMISIGAEQVIWEHLLASLVLLVFLGINLYGVQAAGKSEDIIVLAKVLILLFFAVIGLAYIRRDYILPLFDKGEFGMMAGAALVFVAYEGFELIPNAVNEMRHPQRDLPRAIFVSIGLTIIIYMLVSFVAVGNLLPSEIAKYKEYALAEAAKPFLGQAGFMLIGLAALFSTASAINATLFGTARLSMVMAQEKSLPKAFSLKERKGDIPWLSLMLIAGASLLFVNIADLTVISSFASATFLLSFAAINLSALRLRRQISIPGFVPVLGMLMSLFCWIFLGIYLWRTDRLSLGWIVSIYLVVVAAEFLYSERRIVAKDIHKFLWKRGKLTFQLSSRSPNAMIPDVEEYEPDVLRVFQSKAETKAYYNKIAKFYDLLAEHSEQPMRDKGLEMLAARSGEHILEIGFGTGHCLVEITRAVSPGGKAYGIDISEAMLERSQGLIEGMDLNDRVELTRGDAEHLPQSDNALDAIFTSFTLELFDTPAIPKVLSECRRVLKPRGRLVVVALSKVGKGGLVMKVYEWSHKHFPNLMDCRPIYVGEALKAANFQIADSLIEHMWVPVEIVSGVKKD